MTEIELSDKLTKSLSNFGINSPRGEVCITCSDEGRPVEIVSISTDLMTAQVRGSDGEETVDVSLVGSVQPGDTILVHAGIAITKVEA